MEFAEFIRTPMIDGVVLHKADGSLPIEGTLCVTGHHLILSSRSNQKEELWLQHKNIDSLEKKLTGSQGVLSLKCKDFEVLQLELPTVEDCLNLAMSVEALSNIENINMQYPLFFRPMFDIIEDGWSAFTAESEFGRVKAFSEDWRICHINKNYQVCPSYPQAVFVPKNISDETVVQSAAFRHGGRFPVLSYFHKDNKMVIMRSGQPLTGPNNKRCKEDSVLINSILGIGKRGYIIDIRSQNIAKLAQAKGGGVEPEMHYPQWRRIHQPIERHTYLQESLVKLIDACFDGGASMDKWFSQLDKIVRPVPQKTFIHRYETCFDGGASMDKWLSRLDSCGWLSHVKALLCCACVVAQCVDKEGASVLVHGSEGTDGTLQVTSLAQILLDPDCRTIRGFEALVEREWLQAGHPFYDRCAKSAFSTAKQRHEAPTFLLFLDCVWQVWQQFPLSFEFNEDFILMLFRHAYSSQFGTFLCNNDMERKKHKLDKKTVSLWSYVNRPETMELYMNPLYEPNKLVIWPSIAPQSLQLCDRLYQRHQHYQASHDVIWDEIRKTKEHDTELRSKVFKMRKQIVVLEKEAVDAGRIPLPQAR